VLRHPIKLYTHLAMLIKLFKDYTNKCIKFWGGKCWGYIMSCKWHHSICNSGSVSVTSGHLTYECYLYDPNSCNTKMNMQCSTKKSWIIVKPNRTFIMKQSPMFVKDLSAQVNHKCWRSTVLPLNHTLRVAHILSLCYWLILQLFKDTQAESHHERFRRK